MARLHVALLGGWQVTLDGKPVTAFESDKVRALLAYLAVESQGAHRREKLATLLWPETDEAHARHRFSGTLYNLRQVLGEGGKTGELSAQAVPNGPFLLVTPQTIQFNPHSDSSLDVTVFTALLDEAAHHTHRRLEGCVACAERLEQAISLYQGDFLEGFSLRGCQEFEEWAMVWRERLRLQQEQALASLSRFHEAQGDLPQAIACARRRVELDPLSEDARQQLVRLLALDGQRNAALTQYRTFHKLLAEQLGVEPGPDMTMLHRRIQEEEAGTAPQGNLPIPISPFIGRQNELAELSALLCDPSIRLVTVLGPGGSGKTRLALEAAQRLRYDFPDGLFFIPLSGLASADSLLPSVAGALGLSFRQEEIPTQSTGSAQQKLWDYLRHKKLLLIFDSFEELISGAGWLSELLQAAPGVQALVTTRTRLSLCGEQLFSLGGMTCPSEQETQATLEYSVVLKYSAMQLFLSGARQVQPQFELAEAALPEAAHICRLASGMPLAILLATAWVDTCSLAEIHTEMQRSLDFLSADWRDAPERQRSLRLSLDYSWRLLGKEEREAFRRLSVFRGQFSREAAWQVARVSAPLLRGLVGKCMLMVEGEAYRMHDLVRQYAGEKMAAIPEALRQVQEAHSRYYLASLVGCEARLHSAERSAALNEMDTEIADLQAAWEWAAQRGRVDLLLQGLPLVDYYGSRLRSNEALHACQAALEGLEGGESCASSLRLQAWLLAILAGLHSKPDQHALAQSMVQEGWMRLEQARMVSELDSGIDARRVAARLWVTQGDLTQELAIQLDCYQHSMELYEQLGDAWRKAGTLLWAGEIAQRLGDPDLSQQYHQETLVLIRKTGEPGSLVAALINLAYQYFVNNKVETARQYMQEASEVCEDMEDGPARASTWMHLGVLLGWNGCFPEAILRLEAALPRLRKFGNRFGIVYGSIGLGVGLTMVGEYVRGEAVLRLDFLEAEREGFWREAAAILIGLGNCALGLGRPEEAVGYFQDSARRYREMGFAGELGWALGGLALALQASGQLEAAHTTLKDALGIAVQTHSVFTMMTTWPAVVRWLTAQGEAGQALEAHTLSRRVPVLNSAWYEHVVGREALALAESLPEEAHREAIQRGQQGDIFELAAALLKEL